MRLETMTPFLQLLLALIILIAAAKVSGYLSLRLGQPSVLGELLAGVILGPSLLNITHWAILPDPHLGETIAHLAEVGVLLLMFLAGLELHLSDLAKAGRTASLAGTLGVVTPVLMGLGVGWVFDIPTEEALFLGLVLAATSVSISAQTLMELKVLRSRVGISLLGAAVFDDILVVAGLSLVVALATSSGGFLEVVWILARMILFLVGAMVLGLMVIPRLARLADRLPVSQSLVAFTLIVLLLYAWSAEVLGGMAAITGAFVAGLVFARSSMRDRIESHFSVLAYGFFVPLFFVNVGLHADIRTIGGGSLWLVAALVLVAVVSKILGAGLGALLSGMNRLDALRLGVGMMSRGEVGLIVATVGIQNGLLEPGMFSGIVEVVLITTLLTPPMLRMLFPRPSSKHPVSAGESSPEND